MKQSEHSLTTDTSEAADVPPDYWPRMAARLTGADAKELRAEIERLQSALSSKEAELERLKRQLAAIANWHCESEGCAANSEFIEEIGNEFAKRLYSRAEAALSELERLRNQQVDMAPVQNVDLAPASTPTVSLSEATTWIPVSERLPSVPNNALVCLTDEDGMDDAYSVAAYEKLPGGRIGWNVYDDAFKHCRVTHWMPLPTPPATSEGAAAAGQMSEPNLQNDVALRGKVLEEAAKVAGNYSCSFCENAELIAKAIRALKDHPTHPE